MALFFCLYFDDVVAEAYVVLFLFCPWFGGVDGSVPEGGEAKS